MRADHDTQRRLADAAQQDRGAPLARAPVTVSERVLALQRQAGNAAVVRALGLSHARTLARDPDPAAAGWTFSPLKPDPAAPPAVDLYPWLSQDPAKRWTAEQEMMWAVQRPKAVRIDVTAKGLSQASKTVVDKPPASDPSTAATPASVSSATPDPGQTPDAGSPAPQTVPVAASAPDVKGVQVQVSYGLAGERHTAPADQGGKPTSDWQSSAAVALTVAYHDDERPGWEWSTQFQVNWSDAKVLRAMSPTSLQNVQIGSQLAYVLPLWKNAQWQIFGQIMMGVDTEGKGVAQAAAGGQFQIKLGKGFSLFLQGNIGATQGSGGVTGDASIQGGIIYTWDLPKPK